MPLHPPAGPITVFALDAHRRPVWSEPAWLLRLTPDGAEEVIASSPPHTSLRLIDPATYAMDMGWQVRLSGGGIHALPGPPPPPAKGRASLPDPFDSTRSLSFTVTVPGVLVPNPPPSGAIASTHADAVTVVSDPSPSGAAASTRADTATVGDARTDGEAGSGSGLTGTGAGLAGVGFGHGRVGDDTGIGDGTGGLGATAAVGTRFTTDSPTATRADTATSYGIATSTDIATGQGIGRGTATSTDIATGQGIGRGTGSGAGTNSGAGIGQSIGQGIGGGAGTNSEVGIRGDARDASPASSGTHITNAGNATTDAAIATGAGSDNGTAIATGAGGNNGAATVTSAGGNSGAGVGAGWPGGVGGHRGGGTLPAQEERAGVYRVVVGSAGEVIDDLVWPPLSAMFTALLTDIPAAVDLVVEGKSSAWGGAAERELAERHPGAGVVSGQAREFQRCELLPMPLEPEAPEPPSAVRRARNGLTLLAAAVVVLLVAVAGAVLFWPRGGDGAGLAGGTDPQTAAVPGAGVAAGSPAPSASAASGSASPKASVSASVKASASALASVSGSPGAPSSAASTPPLPLDTATDVARGRPTSESSHTEVYGSGRVTDGDPMSYWESRNNALPQWVQVDLGAPVAVRRVVLRLPPSGAWPARTQNVTVQGSIDGANFTSLTSASCRFDAGNGQRATISVSSGEHRYIRIVISSNTVQPAGQLSSVELYRG
ncbi:discoidin domain-containing protein [Dactylosporangium sp. NBC_01737]|uniref:discoidin domain-containing protein n=1 Tax=Dactylosporangium sp. NBC_01737 TaxID=2975959 RepID=UPI002E1152C6|nr:discoidin domain-containing protein [Dactylosporangium sp. NBC_01737]